MSDISKLRRVEPAIAANRRAVSCRLFAPRGHGKLYAAPVAGLHDAWQRWLLVVAVRRLLLRRRPSNVPRDVAAGVVDPVDGVSRRRPRPDILHKLSDRVRPARFNIDAPAAVIGIALGLRVLASPLHALPRVVLGRVAHAMRHVYAAGVHLPLQAPAASRVAAIQAFRVDVCRLAAITLTGPQTSGWCDSDDCHQPSKSLPCNVFHGVYLISADSNG